MVTVHITFTMICQFIIQALWLSNQYETQLGSKYQLPKIWIRSKNRLNSPVMEWLTALKVCHLICQTIWSHFLEISIWYSDHGLWVMDRKCLKAYKVWTLSPDFGYFWWILKFLKSWLCMLKFDIFWTGCGLFANSSPWIHLVTGKLFSFLILKANGRANICLEITKPR